MEISNIIKRIGLTATLILGGCSSSDQLENPLTCIAMTPAEFTRTNPQEQCIALQLANEQVIAFSVQSDMCAFDPETNQLSIFRNGELYVVTTNQTLFIPTGSAVSEESCAEVAANGFNIELQENFQEA